MKNIDGVRLGISSNKTSSIKLGLVSTITVLAQRVARVAAKMPKKYLVFPRFNMKK